MTTPSSFDWYKLSKIESHKPNLDQFGALIKYAHFGEQLSRVPNSLRLKLLLCFQNASKEIKNEYDKTEEQLRQLQFGKKIVSQRINTLQEELQNSIQKINTDKAVIEDKKRTLNKLKEKMKAKQTSKQSQKTLKSEENYFCPFCTRDDFKSRDTFTFHMYKEHSNNLGNEKTKEQNESGLAGELKQFILSLKDKEIELMQMMLNKKKQMETMELEYVYSQEVKKIRTQNNFNERKQQSLTSFNEKEGYSDYEESQELKGQSQHLFYQKTNHNPKSATGFQHQTNFDYAQERNYKQQSTNKYVPPPQREILQRNDYYNIFQDDQVEQSQKILSSRTDELLKSQQPSIQIQPQYEMPNNYFPQSHVIKTPSVLNQVTRNLSWNQSPIPLQNLPIKPSTQSKLYAYPNQISPNDSNMSQMSEKKYDTFYRASKSNISQVNDGHIFNSGPLVDDIGDGSDYEDYFENNIIEEEEIEDEEIKIANPIASFKNVEQNKQQRQNSQQSIVKPMQNLSIGSYEISHSNNQSNFLLEYSKDKSLLDLSNSKQKSSDLIDLSNSFSKHGYESSKNNESSINLSDLKLSKLERQKQASKRDKVQSKPAEEQSEIQIQTNPSGYEQKQRKYKGNPQVLYEFTREEPPQLQKNMRRTQKSQSNFTNVVKMPENINFLKTNPGILDQFFIQNKGSH